MNRKFLLLLLGGVLSIPAWAIQYQYDELHRLTRVQYDNGASIDYGYDPAGNIVSIAKVAGSGGATPGAPGLARIVGGNGVLKIFFTPPPANGLAISSYTASCTPAAGGSTVTATGTTSPLVVTGLANKVSYTCSIHATNSVGSGSESAALTKKTGIVSIMPLLTIILN
jgi:YD repeat-containing protein